MVLKEIPTKASPEGKPLLTATTKVGRTIATPLGQNSTLLTTQQQAVGQTKPGQNHTNPCLPSTRLLTPSSLPSVSVVLVPLPPSLPPSLPSVHLWS